MCELNNVSELDQHPFDSLVLLLMVARLLPNNQPQLTMFTDRRLRAVGVRGRVYPHMPPSSDEKCTFQNLLSKLNRPGSLVSHREGTSLNCCGRHAHEVTPQP